MLKYLILISLFVGSLQIDNCLISKKICKTCPDDYSLVEYSSKVKCVKTAKLKELQKIDINCIEGSNGNCISCKRDYVWSRNQAKCIYSPHCLTLNNFDNCISCSIPFQAFNGTCIVMPYCKKIGEDRKCKECVFSYYIDENGDCAKIPIEFCIKGNATHCDYCIYIGYYLENGKCKKVNLEHCLAGNSTYCEMCELSYYKENGKCKKIPKAHCFSGNSTFCYSCESGYYLKNGECKEVNKNDHCITYFSMDDDYDDHCINCENYYYIENGECKKIEIPNCITYLTSSKSCYTCDDGYDLNEEKTCMKCPTTEVICEGCNENYETFDYGKTCKKLDDEDFIIINKNEGINFNSAILALILTLIL